VTKTTLRAMTDLIERHCAHMRQRGLSDNSINDRRALLGRVDQELPMGLEEATVEELSNWLARAGWSRSTRATYFAHVRGFFDWATDERNPHLDWNPAASLTRPKVPQGVPKPVTDDELVEALRTAGEWRVAIILAAYAGLRCCELATVTRRDINNHTITVTGKGDKTRVIPTAEVAWKAVSGMSGKLVVGGARDISGRARDHFEKVGLAGVTLHRFRHWFATTMLAAGVDLLTVSKLLGHASTSTTSAYCLITDGQRRSAVATLPVLTTAPAST
jgi:site-specific recombinase XerD